MSNRDAWEQEYQEPKLLALTDVPTREVVKFIRWLKKQKLFSPDWRVLDLGAGAGRNAIYLASLGCSVVGLEFSTKAVVLARERAAVLAVPVDFREHDIGTRYPFAAEAFDLVLDVTSSNSLSQEGRKIYLEETARVLKPGSFFFVRALCKDGDKNAKNLLTEHPGPEPDTYIMPEMNLVERVFSREDFVRAYSPYFQIEQLEKTTHYSRFNGRRYKRNFWIAYLRKAE